MSNYVQDPIAEGDGAAPNVAAADMEPAGPTPVVHGSYEPNEDVRASQACHARDDDHRAERAAGDCAFARRGTHVLASSCVDVLVSFCVG